MNEKMAQDQRLDYLVKKFKADSDEYEGLKTSDDTNGKRRILRSLMNIRMPWKMDATVLRIQDEYMKNVSAKRHCGVPGYLCDTGWSFHLSGRYHASCRGRDREYSQFANAWLFYFDAYLY